jgi:hypothetical protein
VEDDVDRLVEPAGIEVDADDAMPVVEEKVTQVRAEESRTACHYRSRHAATSGSIPEGGAPWSVTRSSVDFLQSAERGRRPSLAR